MIEQGKVTKTYRDVLSDISGCIMRCYYHMDKDWSVLKASTYGSFFPEVFKNPNKYIERQDDLIKILTKLREQGKWLFIGTNSHFEFMELILTSTIGENWRQYFDAVFCFCRKPLFFNAKPAMYVYDESVGGKLYGPEVQSLEENSKEVTYMEGNCGIINNHLE